MIYQKWELKRTNEYSRNMLMLILREFCYTTADILVSEEIMLMEIYFFLKLPFRLAPFIQQPW